MIGIRVGGKGGGARDARGPGGGSSAGGGGGSFANEPPGNTLIEDQPWNTALPPQWVDSAGSQDWLDLANGGVNARGSIVTDATAPQSPSNIVQGLFKAGDAGGSGPFHILREFRTSAPNEQYKNLYIGIVLKQGANFDLNGNIGTKYLWPAGDQVDGTATYMTFDGSDMNFGIAQQGGVINPVDGSNNRLMTANVAGNTTLGRFDAYLGLWKNVEIVLRANTDNATFDGSLDLWIAGAHTHHYVDVNWQMQASRKWMSLAWNPTFGGGTNPVPHDQSEYIDHLRISGSDL